MIKDYYRLTKPGIIYGNTMTTVAGFLFASRWHINAGLFAAAIIGISFVIGSACVFNNYIDRGLDDKMARTKKRALVAGRISGRNALVFGTVLGLLGAAILSLGTNLATTILGLLGFFFYVVAYSIAKRATVHGTLVGTISGSVPIAAGYVAVTGRFDLGAWLLFLIMVAWQMPHFFAIAVYRLGDYRHAGLPVLPVVRGIPAAKRQILAYIALFAAAVASLSFFGYAGITYLVVMLALSLYWLKLALDGFKKRTDDTTWARGLFKFSLLVLLALSATISLNAVLP